MYCRNCGQEISDKAKFCPRCGFKQDRIVSVSPKTHEKTNSYDIAAILTCSILTILLLTNWLEINYWFINVQVKPLNLIVQMINLNGIAEICEQGTQEFNILTGLGLCAYVPLLFNVLGLYNALIQQNAKTLAAVGAVCEIILVIAYLIISKSIEDETGISVATSWTYITLIFSIVGIIFVAKAEPKKL